MTDKPSTRHVVESAIDASKSGEPIKWESFWVGPQRATPASVGRIEAEVKATKQQLEQEGSR